jgi:hypothetical protein
MPCGTFIEAVSAIVHSRSIKRSLGNPETKQAPEGMLFVGGEHLASNLDPRLVMYGQERNSESYAICKAVMLINVQDVASFICGNMLQLDKYSARCAP